MNKAGLVVMLSGAVLLLSGCGPDVEAMKKGLLKAGFSAEKAACFAEKAADSGTPNGPYDYIAKLLAEGVPEKDAVNRARRKYGAEFKQPYNAAKKECGI